MQLFAIKSVDGFKTVKTIVFHDSKMLEINSITINEEICKIKIKLQIGLQY